MRSKSWRTKEIGESNSGSATRHQDNQPERRPTGDPAFQGQNNELEELAKLREEMDQLKKDLQAKGNITDSQATLLATPFTNAAMRAPYP